MGDSDAVEAGKSVSVLHEAVDILPTVRDADGTVRTVPFLQCSRIAVRVLEQFGASMILVRQDINGNISRLQTAYDKDPELFTSLFEIVHKDIEDGKQSEAYSNSNGMLWLSRAMDFIVTFLSKLESHPDWTAAAAAKAAYQTSLQPHHGWITRRVFSMALHLVPQRSHIVAALGGGDSVRDDIRKVAELFAPIIQQNKDFLKSKNINNAAP